MTKRQAWINPSDFQHATVVLAAIKKITGQYPDVDVTPDATRINMQIINDENCGHLQSLLTYYFKQNNIKHTFYTSHTRSKQISYYYTATIRGKFGINMFNDKELYSKKDKVRLYNY